MRCKFSYKYFVVTIAFGMLFFCQVSTASTAVLGVDATALDFGETDTSKSVQVTNSGDGTLVWLLYEDEDWIAVDATSGSLETGESSIVNVEVDRSKSIRSGVVNATLILTSNGGDAEIEISMFVPDQPVLDVLPETLDFSSEYVVKELFISNSGTGVLHWTIDTEETWIVIEQEAGQTNDGETDSIYIAVDRSAATELGSYKGELIITSDGGDINVRVAMEKINHAPEIPTVISPVDGATNQSLYTTLTWQGGDPDTGDGDTITYDVYFSTNEMLVDIEDVSVLTCKNMNVCYCEPGTNSLDGETTYHWKVVARDSHGGMTSSSIWHFATGKNATSLCPAFAMALDFGELSLLRQLRDHVLTKDVARRNYIHLYYHYSLELFLIMIIHDELGEKTREVFKKFVPAIRSVLDGRDTFVTVEMMGDVKELIETISTYASPPLKAVLHLIGADISNREKMEAFGIIIDDGESG